MDFRQRRLKSERNMTILTSNDFKSNNAEKKNKKSSKKVKRTESKKLYIYGNYESDNI